MREGVKHTYRAVWRTPLSDDHELHFPDLASAMAYIDTLPDGGAIYETEHEFEPMPNYHTFHWIPARQRIHENLSDRHRWFVDDWYAL